MVGRLSQVKGRYPFDAAVVNSKPVFHFLISCEDQSLLIWRNAFFVLDLSLQILNCVSEHNIKSKDLSSQCLHEYLEEVCSRRSQVRHHQDLRLKIPDQGSTSTAIFSPVGILMKICIPPLNQRTK